MKDLNYELGEMTKELQTMFPSTYFKITNTSDVFILIVDDPDTATEACATPEYILKYPPGTDMALIKSIIDKY